MAWPSTRWPSRSPGTAWSSIVVDAGRLGATRWQCRSQTARQPCALSAAVRPFPGTRLRIVDEQGIELPERHVGRDRRARTLGHARLLRQRGGHRRGAPRRLARHRRPGVSVDGGDSSSAGERKTSSSVRAASTIRPDLESAIADVSGIALPGVVVFGITRVDEPDEVVAVLEARASLRASTTLSTACAAHPRNRRARNRPHCRHAARDHSAHDERQGPARRDPRPPGSRDAAARGGRELVAMSLFDKLASRRARLVECRRRGGAVRYGDRARLRADRSHHRAAAAR